MEGAKEKEIQDNSEENEPCHGCAGLGQNRLSEFSKMYNTLVFKGIF